MKLRIENCKLRIKIFLLLLTAYSLMLTACYAQTTAPKLMDWDGTSKGSFQIGVGGDKIKFNSDSSNYYIKYFNGVWDSTQFVGTKNPRGNSVWQDIVGRKWFKTYVRIDTLDTKYFKLQDGATDIETMGSGDIRITNGSYPNYISWLVYYGANGLGGRFLDSLATLRYMRDEGKTKNLTGGSNYSLPYQDTTNVTLFFTPSLADTNKVLQFYNGGWRLTSSPSVSIDSTIWAKRSWVTANFLSSADTNIVDWTTAYNKTIINGSFGTSDGLIALGKQDGTTLYVDIDGRYLETETDPVFSASPANIVGWTANDLEINVGGYVQINATNWGDKSWVGSQGFLTTETDPVFSASPANIVGWTANDLEINVGGYVQINATNWGDKTWVGSQGFLTTETDPVFSASPANIVGWTTNDLEVNVGGYVQINATNWGDKTWVGSQGFLTTETDPVFSASPANIVGWTANDLEVNIGGYVQINSTNWGDKSWISSNYTTFPGFGTTGTTAAYGNHTHSTFSGTITFTDSDAYDHTVSITNGIITNWEKL